MGTSTTTYIGLVYGLSIFIASIAGMGSAFLANRIYPLKGGDQPPPPTAAEVATAVKKAEKADTDARTLADKLAESQVPKPKEDEETVPVPTQTPTEEETAPTQTPTEEETAPATIEDATETRPIQNDVKGTNREAYIAQLKETLHFPSEEDAKDALDILETPAQSLTKIPNIGDKINKLFKFLWKNSNGSSNVIEMLRILLVKTDRKQSPGNDEQIIKDLHSLIPPAAS